MRIWWRNGPPNWRKSTPSSNRKLKSANGLKEALRKREIELKAQSHHLEEVNTALKVLLKQREEDKKELGENVLSNVKELIAPYLERLKKSRLTTNQQTLVNILESNLSNMISPFISKLSFKYFQSHTHGDPGGKSRQGGKN